LWKKKDAPDTQEMLKTIQNFFIPNKIQLLADAGEGQEFLVQKLEFLKTMKMLGGKATAFVCEDFTCQLPTTSTEDLRELLSKKTH